MTELVHEGEVFDPPAPGPDYIVQFRIKNGPLLRAMRARGFKTVAAFARACNVYPQCIFRYLSLTQAPIKKNGQWAPTSLLMAEVLRMPPESLFPVEHLERALKRSSGEFNLTAAEMRELVVAADNPERELITHQMEAKLHDLVDHLPPRHKRVIEARYGLDDGRVHTLDEIAKEFGVQRERIRQIEGDAMRRLAKPTVRNELKKVADVPSDSSPYSRWSRHEYGKHYAKSARHYVPYWKRDEAAAAEEAEEFARQPGITCPECGEEIAPDAARRKYGNYFWHMACWKKIETTVFANTRNAS